MMELSHAFAHFTIQQSEGKFVVLDIQGIGGIFIDPAIVTDSAVDPGAYLFTPANNRVGLGVYKQQHICNTICKQLNLLSIGSN